MKVLRVLEAEAERRLDSLEAQVFAAEQQAASAGADVTPELLSAIHQSVAAALAAVQWEHAGDGAATACLEWQRRS
jgi:hypothetical protein